MGTYSVWLVVDSNEGDTKARRRIRENSACCRSGRGRDRPRHQYEAFRIAESFFIAGDRTNSEEVRAMLDTGVFLLAEDASGLLGCVHVEIRGVRGYFGLLAVEPSAQHNGLGRTLVAAAEDYARQAGCPFMDLRIMNLRTELPPFYQRLGFVETGAEPFPADVKPKLPCHFVKMSKHL